MIRNLQLLFPRLRFSTVVMRLCYCINQGLQRKFSLAKNGAVYHLKLRTPVILDTIIVQTDLMGRWMYWSWALLCSHKFSKYILLEKSTSWVEVCHFHIASSSLKFIFNNIFTCRRFSSLDSEISMKVCSKRNVQETSPVDRKIKVDRSKQEEYGPMQPALFCINLDPRYKQVRAVENKYNEVRGMSGSWKTHFHRLWFTVFSDAHLQKASLSRSLLHCARDAVYLNLQNKE